MTDRATGTLCRIFAWHADQGVLQRNTTTRTPLLLLALALLAVASAPLLDLAASRLRGGRAGLDGFVLVAVSGLVLLHVLPHAIRLGGPVVIGFAALGLFLPLAIESWTREAAQSAHAWALRLALLGLVAHATLDGAALYNGHEPELALAVILHRIPAALAVWVLVRPGRGAMVAWSLLGAMILATVVGWGLGPALHNLDDRLLGMFSGLVSGSLLHVVVHRPHHHPLPEEARTGGVGALLGVVAVGLPRRLGGGGVPRRPGGTSATDPAPSHGKTTRADPDSTRCCLGAGSTVHWR